MAFRQQPAAEGLLNTLDLLIGQGPLQRVLSAAGSASPTPGATVTGTPRLVVCLQGRNHMRLPRGPAVIATCLEPGEAVFVASGAWNDPSHREAHRFLTLDVTPAWVRYYHALVLPGRVSQGPRRWHFRIGGVAPATRHLVAAMEAQPSPDPADDPTLRHLAQALLLRLRAEWRPAEQAEAPGLDQWRRACQWLDEHRGQPIGRAEVARAIGVHPNHLARLCRRFGTESFRDLLTRRRLEFAADLLTRHPISAQEAARRCGFADAAWFSHAFRRHFGLPPARWRQERRELLGPPAFPAAADRREPAS